MKKTNAIIVDNKDDAQGIWWVNQARTKDETRYVLLNLYVKNGMIFGTDGRRLHRYLLEEPISDGLYSPIVVNKTKTILLKDTDGLTYPDCENIIPKAPTLSGTPDLPADADVAVAFILRMTPADVYIDYKYVEQALNIDVPFKLWSIPKDPFCFYHEKYFVVIMGKSARRK